MGNLLPMNHTSFPNYYVPVYDRTDTPAAIHLSICLNCMTYERCYIYANEPGSKKGGVLYILSVSTNLNKDLKSNPLCDIKLVRQNRLYIFSPGF